METGPGGSVRTEGRVRGDEGDGRKADDGRGVPRKAVRKEDEGMDIGWLKGLSGAGR